MKAKQDADTAILVYQRRSMKGSGVQDYLLPGRVSAVGVTGGASSSFLALFPRGFLPPFGVPDRERCPLGLLGAALSSSGGGVGCFVSSVIAAIVVTMATYQ